MITFQVVDVWKGEISKTATLQFRFGEDDDVQAAMQGETWLIFAVDHVAVGVCGGESRRWSDDLAVFRPAGAHPPSDPARHRVSVPVTLIGVVALFLVGIFTFERRRHARPVEVSEQEG